MNNIPNQDFEKLIYTYYNQYCASPAVTEKRRIMRNYLSNNQSIQQNNVNPFLQNPNKRYYFQDNKMYINEGNILYKYIRTGSVWCFSKKEVCKEHN